MDNLVFLSALGVLGALLSWLGVRFIRSYAISRQMSEAANDSGSDPVPNSQNTEAPRGGGLAVLVVVLLIFMPVGLGLGDPSQVVRFALSGAFIGIIGFFDDFRSLPRLGRLALQALAALIFVPAAPIREIALPYIQIPLSEPLAYAISVVWIVVMSNAYNYMDGIDGLAGGQAVLAGGLWAGVGLVEGDPLVFLLGVLISGASAGFLVYNLPPASIFLGDVGTTFLGFSLAALPMLTVARGGSARLIISGGLIVGLFLFDAAFTFLRYLLDGVPRSRAYRSHLYQRLVQVGEPPYRVTLLYLLLSVGFGIAGLIYWLNETWMAVLISALACVVLFAWITYRESVKEVQPTPAPESKAHRRGNSP